MRNQIEQVQRETGRRGELQEATRDVLEGEQDEVELHREERLVDKTRMMEYGRL